MSRLITVTLHSIAGDGLPDMDAYDLVGRVAFVWDGYIVSGWPLAKMGRPDDWWEPADDRFGGPLAGVTHWLEFPVPAWDLAAQQCRLCSNRITRSDRSPTGWTHTGKWQGIRCPTALTGATP